MRRSTRSMSKGSRERDRRVAQFPEKLVLCDYCGSLVPRERITTDHKIPVCRGGNSKPSNIALACRRCNQEKGPLTDKEYLAAKKMGCVKAKKREIHAMLTAQREAQNADSNASGTDV